MMNNKISIILILLTLLFVGFSSEKAAAYDAELVESSKCGRYFALFEDSYNMPSNLMKAVAITESGRYVKSAGKSMPWPWTVNVEGKGYYFSSKREAVRAVAEFRSKGFKSIDVGCMQINLLHHPEAFRNLDQAFEPKYNIAYAAQFLREKYVLAKNWQQAIGMYHNVNPEINKNYIKQVYAAWSKEDKSAKTPKFAKRASIFVSGKALQEASKEEADVAAITVDALKNFAR